MESAVKLVAEWIEGESNGIADSHLSLADHTALLLSHFPHQIPDGFQISPLPAEISLWVSLFTLAAATRLSRCPPRPAQSKLVSGADGSPILVSSTIPETFSSSPSTLNPFGTSNPSSSAVLPKPCARANFKPEVVKAWLQAQSKVTSDHWYKPSELLSRQIPRSTLITNYHAFYHDSTPVLPALTCLLDAKRLSVSESSSLCSHLPCPSSNITPPT
jgi:hypothetical protein